MKTYIINLERSVQRREHIVSEAEGAGLNYEIVEAVDGSLLSSEQIEELCDMERVRQLPEWLCPGAIGAALSHRSVYKRMVENGDPYALILEDDAILPENLSELLDGIASVLKESEIALLYYSSSDPLPLSTVDSSQLTERHSLMYPTFLKGVGGAVCYVISRTAAKAMYDGVLPIGYSADSWVDFVEKGIFDSLRCVYPMEVDHLGVKSTISSTTQGRLRRKITELINDHKIPILHSALIRLRRDSLDARMKFSVTNSPSPIAKNSSIPGKE